MSKLFLILLFPGILFSETLSVTAMAKLSPDLQTLVTGEQQGSSNITERQFFRVHTVTGAQQEVLYPITIRSTDIEQVKAVDIKTNSDHANWSTARVTYDQLIQLTEISSVTAIFQGDMLYPLNDLAVGLSGADLVHDGYLNNVAYDGSGVIVLIIDTGIDWSHLDFRSPTNSDSSRILYIWDQTLTKGDGEDTPEDRDGTNFSGLNYGVEYTQEQIETEFGASPPGFVRTRDNSTYGHGTAIAGAAVGNGAFLLPDAKKYKGMAPNADIVIVKAGENSFLDDNIKNALTYARKISETKTKPVVVNLSLGNQSHAHDGTASLDEAVDAFISSGNGRVAVVAAGNEGNDEMHVSNSSVAKDDIESITINVPSATAGDSFEFELWWNNNELVDVEVESPGATFSFTVTADQVINNTSTDHADGTIYITNGTDDDHSNGNRKVYVKVYDGEGSNGLKTGNWTVKATNQSEGSMSYHAWLFASSMDATLTGGDNNYTIASPGVAASAITVGSFSSRWRYTDSSGNTRNGGTPNLSDDLSYFSSIGPAVGDGQKPDICAPGLGLITSTSTDYSPESDIEIIANKYHLTQGTSGSAGVVSGAVALMLDYDKTLSAATVKSKLTSNADEDSYTGSVPNSEWGYGKLNIFQSLAKTINNSATVNCDVYSYDEWGGSSALASEIGYKQAVRFRPDIAGDVTGAFFHMGEDVPGSGTLSFQVYEDNGNLPSDTLGTIVTMNVADIAAFTWNYVSLKGISVSVEGSTEYHLVIENTGGSATFRVGTSSVDNRSTRNTGSGWAGPYSSFDWRIRPVVSTDESTLDSSLPVELAFFNAGTNKGQLVLKWATESEFENLGFSIARRTGKLGDWKTIADHTTHAKLKGQGSTTSRTDYLFVDKFAKPGVKYDYRLTDIPYSAVAKATTIILEDVRLMIEDFELFANYPNPFNPSTHIAYQLAQTGDVRIRITDVQGREIRSWEVKSLEPGYHETLWEGLTSDGQPVSAGIYFATVQAGTETRSQKLLLVK